MVNYQNGKVYKIINENNEIIYIGSTTEEKLCKRYAKHKLKAPNHKIILIENYPCNSKEELCKREQQIIEEHSNLLNKQRAYCSKEQRKEYEEKRKGTRNEYHKQHNEKRKNNPEYIEYQKQYNEKRKHNPEYIEYHKQHNEKRKVKVICEFCKCELRLDGLKKHQKTMKCMKFQECLSLD